MKIEVKRNRERSWEKASWYDVSSPFFSGSLAFNYNQFYGPILSVAEDKDTQWHSSDGKPLPWPFPADWFRAVRVATDCEERWLSELVVGTLANQSEKTSI